jgi:hypothetical protein
VLRVANRRKFMQIQFPAHTAAWPLRRTGSRIEAGSVPMRLTLSSCKYWYLRLRFGACAPRIRTLLEIWMPDR